MEKRILSILLAAAMLASFCVTPAFADDAPINTKIEQVYHAGLLLYDISLPDGWEWDEDNDELDPTKSGLYTAKNKTTDARAEITVTITPGVVDVQGYAQGIAGKKLSESDIDLADVVGITDHNEPNGSLFPERITWVSADTVIAEGEQKYAVKIELSETDAAHYNLENDGEYNITVYGYRKNSTAFEDIPQQIEGYVGETGQLQVTAVSGQPVYYRSSTPEVISIDKETGAYKLLSATTDHNHGAVVVYVVENDQWSDKVSGAIPVIVKKYTAKWKEGKEPADMTLQASAQEKIVAEAERGGNVTYTVKDESVLAVEEDGTLKPLKAGTTTVTVTVEETPTATALSKDITITILKDNPKWDAGKEPLDQTILLDAENEKITAKANMGGNITYTVEDETVLTVAEDGTLNPLKVGTTAVTITVETTDVTTELSKTITITVVEAAEITFMISEEDEDKGIIKDVAGLQTSEKVVIGDTIIFPEVVPHSKYAFKGWAMEGTDTLVDTSKAVSTADITYVAVFEDMHTAYIEGRPNEVTKVNEFQPYEKLPRSEAAIILARIDGFEDTDVYTSADCDLKDIDNVWAKKYIMYCYDAGIINGYPDHNFKPAQNITRGEFAKMLAEYAANKLDETIPADGTSTLSDAKGNFYEKWIAYLERKGIAEGYGDDENSFKPDHDISRAEAVTMVNRVLGREQIVVKTASDALNVESRFPDVKKTDWFFNNVLEAAVEHAASDSKYHG